VRFKGKAYASWGTALLIALLLASLALGQGIEPGALTNPLNTKGGADPWLTYYDGNYYLATTTWASELTMRTSPTLAGLKTAEPLPIYYETDPSRCCNMWAPEFHLLDGPNGERWYFYYSAGTANSLDDQRTHVLESAGTDPTGPYTYKGRLFDPQNDTWAIDGSVLELGGKLYFLFSAWVGADQSIFIAPLRNPWTLSGKRVLISKPEYAWETVGLNVNEAPVALHHDGDTFIVYSASFCGTPDYKLGLLTYKGGDPLDKTSWEKRAEPVFQRSHKNGVYAPAHNGFFRSPDGSEDWIVYHANSSAEGGCDGRRTTRAQEFSWNDDGTPNFGVPVSSAEVLAAPSGDTGVDPLPVVPETVVSRFRSFGLPDAYLHHSNFSLSVGYGAPNTADAQFALQPGLADPGAVSIESVNYPGFFVRRQGNVIVLGADDRSENFAAEATWWLRPGLADRDWLSLEAYNRPGHYLGKRFGITALMKLSDATTDLEGEDATFLEVREPNN
jgi:GH43 family beta-xylosidase